MLNDGGVRGAGLAGDDALCARYSVRWRMLRTSGLTQCFFGVSVKFPLWHFSPPPRKSNLTPGGILGSWQRSGFRSPNQTKQGKKKLTASSSIDVNIISSRSEVKVTEPIRTLNAPGIIHFVRKQFRSRAC